MGSPELPAPESEGSSSTTAEASTGALRGLLLRVAALKARGAGLSWIRPDGIRQARFSLRQHVRIYGIKSAAKKLAPPFVSNMVVGSVLFGTQSVVSNALTKSTLGHTESGTPTNTIATETLAGSVAGFVHACVAAPLQSVTHGARNWSRKVLFAELPILLGRDIVGRHPPLQNPLPKTCIPTLSANVAFGHHRCGFRGPPAIPLQPPAPSNPQLPRHAP